MAVWHTQPGRRLLLGLATTAALSAVLLGVALAIPDLRAVLVRLRHASDGWIASAVALEIASCAGYALAFQAVFFELPRGLAALIAWAESAFGAVVPIGGAGGIAAGAWVLHRRGITNERIAKGSGELFLFTSALNTVTLLLAGGGLSLGILDGPSDLLRAVAPALLAAGALAAFLALAERARRHARPQHGRVRLAAYLTGQTTLQTLQLIRRPGGRLALGSLAYLGCDIAVLWCALHAVGLQTPAGVLIVAYLLGYLVDVLPIPGGLAVLDGGLAGALIAYGAPVHTAAAGVLIYHTVALWIPTLGGTLAFALATHRTHPDRPATTIAPPSGARGTEPASNPGPRRKLTP